jgi:hypothetical protein
MSKGIDSSTPLTAATAKKIAAAGYGFAARYLVPAGFPKRLTRAEAEVITASGMQIVSVFETTAARPTGGAKNGNVDGAVAYHEALAIGQPKGSSIYFACDWDAGLSDYDSIEAYLRAAGSQIPGYKVGVYGSFAVIEAMIGRSAAECGWQTYAWSRGKKSALANIYQHQNDVSVAGIAVDLNESYGNEGWWDTKPVVLNPDPSNAPLPIGDDKYKVVVNDVLAAYGRMFDGHVYLPLRKLGEALGKAVYWDNVNKIPYIDDKAVDAFRIIDGLTYVQVRKAAELLGGTVSWVGTTKKVYFYE